MTSPAAVLQVGPLPDEALDRLRAAFRLISLENSGDPESDAPLAGVVGIATTGKAAIGPDVMDQCPRLTVISCLGAGSEGIDAAAAARRGITIATTSAVLADDVADVALGLIIGLSRNFRGADQFVRAGGWERGRLPPGRALKGATLGILGLGSIGAALARRAAVSGLAIGYHNRHRKPGSPLRYFEDLGELAGWSRFLAVCCPGGPSTRHLVDAAVLDALGPDGHLVNVARGSVVDEVALVRALDAGRIAGAGLDVYEDEPYPHPRLLANPRTLLLPHIGSATVETRSAMAHAMVDVLVSALAGR